MNKTAKIVLGVVVIALVIWAIVSGSHKGTSSDAIKVGIISPLTGSAASYGVEGKNAIVMALDEINAAGGIAGKKIEYFAEDGKCDAATAVSAWNKLVSVNHVSLVFGGGCSTETLTIAPLAARDQVPAFAVFTTSPKVANEGDWVFRNISTNEYYGTILAEQAYKKGYRSVALITEVKDFPVTYTDAFIKKFTALGGTIALDERFDPGIKDYRTQVLKLKGLKYDALFISTQASDVSALVTLQVKALGLEKPYIYNHGFALAPFLKASGGYVPNSLLSVGPYADPQSPKMQTFAASYLAKYGTKYNFTPFFVGAEYDMVYRVKAAGDACSADSLKLGGLSVSCVIDQFKHATTYSGIVGDVTISSQYSPYGILTPVGLVKIIGTSTQTFEAIK